MFKAGVVKMIYAINNSNYEVHQQLAESDDVKDKILFVYNVNCNRAVFDDLVSTLQTRQGYCYKWQIA